MHIITASTNPVKIEAARQGFALMFSDANPTVSGVKVPSGVAAQPMTDAETLQGARNRAHNAHTTQPQADYWIGIEGGADDRHGALTVFAWVVIYDGRREGHSRTATFTLPDEVAGLVRQGVELGHADDQVFGRSNSKQANGAVGLLTNDVIDRTGYYVHAVALALIPFLNPGLTWPLDSPLR